MSSPKSSKAGRNTRKPAAQRYKASNRRVERKLKNLMRQNGMTRAEAIAFRESQQAQARAATHTTTGGK